MLSELLRIALPPPPLASGSAAPGEFSLSWDIIKRVKDIKDAVVVMNGYGVVDRSK